MKKIFYWPLLFLLLATPSCRAQDAAAPQAENEEGMPLGKQDDDAELTNAGNKSIHEPTAEERNFKASAQNFKVAENGKALALIVVARKASGGTLAAARDLAEILGRVSGATFEIQTPDGKEVDDPEKRAGNYAARKAAAEKLKAEAEANRALPPETLPQKGIVVGTKTEFVAPADLQGALALGDDVNGREAYAIRTNANRVLLLAGEERGVVHAVNRLLHEIGCRWFFTGANWEIIPDIKNLTFGFDITDRPTMATRIIAFMDGSFKDDNNVPLAQSRETLDKAKWLRRNPTGASLRTSAAHVWHRIVAANGELLLQHPEYFAEINGERQVPYLRDKDGKMVLDKNGKPQLGAGLNAKFELANPAVRQLFVDYALNYFKNNPDADMVSVDPTDGGGHSQSAESKKLGSVSNAVFGMANEVARAVKKEYPDKYVGLLAYNHHIAPPDFELEDNIYIEITAGFNTSKFSYAQLYEMWPKKAKNIGFYEYFSVFDWDKSALPGGRVANIEWLKNRMHTYAGMNAASVFGQSTNSWGANGRGLYLAPRLMWNPDADVTALLKDFYEKAYGPAVPAMKRFHESIAPGGSGGTMGANLIGKALLELQEASTLAKDRPDVLARISDYKQYMRYIYLRNEEANAGKEEGRAKFIEMMQQLCAMRYSYMAHWAGAQYRLGKLVAAKYNDITLINSWSRKHPKFGKIAGDRDAPDIWSAPEPTTEKIEADFLDALKRYPFIETNDVQFDMSDLVPVEFPPVADKLINDSAIEAMRRDYNQYQPRHVFYSFAGEPIEVVVSAGQIKKNNREAVWELRKSDESIVDTGKVPLDKAAHPLSIKVPAAGMYYFDFLTNSNGGTVEYSTSKPGSVVWKQGSFDAKGFDAAFFYVPKGTKEISYFYNTSGGRAHVILQPDGKVAATLNGAGQMTQIVVPPGMDGQLWRYKRASPLRSQWFFNVPNIAAGSPDGLLIPRALAKKDGLKIREK